MSICCVYFKVGWKGMVAKPDSIVHSATENRPERKSGTEQATTRSRCLYHKRWEECKYVQHRCEPAPGAQQSLPAPKEGPRWGEWRWTYSWPGIRDTVGRGFCSVFKLACLQAEDRGDVPVRHWSLGTWRANLPWLQYKCETEMASWWCWGPRYKNPTPACMLIGKKDHKDRYF